MRNSTYLLFFILITSCGPKKIKDAEQPEKKTPVVTVKKDARTIGPAKSAEQIRIEEAIEKIKINKNDPVVGYWVGMFGKNKINIAIAEVKDGQALGYTVCAGNFRPITGKVQISGEDYRFDMNEPGTDQYDGHFDFTVNIANQEMKGRWAPFKKDKVAGKDFALTKVQYVYQPGIGTYPEASSRLLDEVDVSNLVEKELQLMRNEIYARHGYSFKDLTDRRYFDTIQWYIPMGVDIRQNLTDIEVQNIDLIYRYEDYYNEHYDDYGR